VLLAADFAVVLGGGFEEFVAAVGGKGAHARSLAAQRPLPSKASAGGWIARAAFRG
jgi:hypothetical protein